MIITELIERSQQKSDQCSNFIIENINGLNDDCLIHIFEFLSIEYKLKAEMVCTRWNRLAKLAWTKVHSLKIVEFSDLFIEDSKKIEQLNNFISNVLIRCGSYVNNLLVLNDSRLGLGELKKQILKYCSNVHRLCLSNKNLQTNFYIDNDLQLLIKRNGNIRSLTLEKITVTNGCLEILPIEKVEEFEILSCNFTSENYLYDLISRLSNLKKFKILSFAVDPIRIFEELLNTGCTSVSEFTLLSIRGATVNYNKEFIAKQKNLRTVSLQNVIITKEIIESLSKTLEEIRYAICNKELINSLHQFSKLQTLLLFFKSNDFKILTAKHLKIISQVIDVKYIKFSNCFCILTNNKNSFFKILKNVKKENILNRFSVGIERKIDKLLEIIRPCKNLESLNIADCNFTGLGVTYINKFSNLKNLNISLNNKITDDWLILIIKKLLKLEKLFVFHCPLITNYSIRQANEIKKKRNDVKKLEVFCYGTNIIKDDFQKNLMIILNDTTENLKI